MRQRLITLIAVTALLIGGTVPALAGRPDNPGGDRGASADHIDVRGENNGDEDGDRRGPPEWAKAYGWRILDAYGLPYGLLKQCNPDFVPDEEGEVSEGYEAFGVNCEDVLEFEDVEATGTIWPDEPGAMAFWTGNERIFAD